MRLLNKMQTHETSTAPKYKQLMEMKSDCVRLKNQLYQNYNDNGDYYCMRRRLLMLPSCTSISQVLA
jgi:hypothetical protein